MSHMLDLSRRAFDFQRGNITVIGTWVQLDFRRWRPCLVLVRTGEELREDTWPCVVTVDQAWIWSEEIGDPQRAAHQAMAFAQALRLGDTPQTVIRIASLIHDHLGDLLGIPPYQGPDDEPVAEVTITDRATGRTREVLV